ncbi:hypothetical protein Syun_023396 [Stephania yunnanensis]|uniref:Uncharacterized protein n=1 Tax=Stephania yunnanensis TaxID=152371 RepID=A0AAP0I3F5_9MAGN
MASAGDGKIGVVKPGVILDKEFKKSSLEVGSWFKQSDLDEERLDREEKQSDLRKERVDLDETTPDLRNIEGVCGVTT